MNCWRITNLYLRKKNKSAGNTYIDNAGKTAESPHNTRIKDYGYKNVLLIILVKYVILIYKTILNQMRYRRKTVEHVSQYFI